MALPLVFTANGREPPGRHLSSTRFQIAFSTGVEAALASLLGFTSEQPDGDRSHCGAPGSRTTALVPEGAGRCRVRKELVCESRGNRFESEDSRLIRRPCRCGEPGGCAVHTTGVGGVCCSEETSTGDTSIAGGETKSLRGGSEFHRRNKFRRANAKFAQPEVRPAPERPHRSSQNVDRRDNRQHHYAGALVAD